MLVANGVARRRVTLVLPVVGPAGRAAQAAVRYDSAADGAGGAGVAGGELEVEVRLPGGGIIQLDGGGHAARVIRVASRDVGR
jgi:hypothetical protein